MALIRSTLKEGKMESNNDFTVKLQSMHVRMELLRLAVNNPEIKKDDKLKTAQKWWDEFVKPGVEPT